ncbi:MAG TPA: ComF family protein [Terracidiphilus sp.]|nr:ComF family protein [Terracidiphilus sp.]
MCRLAPPPFVRAVAYGPYESRLKDAIHALKYDRLVPASRELGCRLAHAIAQLADEAPAEMLVVPVPLHRAKYSDRGFNQAHMLATHAVAFLRCTHSSWHLTLLPHALERQRATGSQAGLTARQRRLNLRGAFRVPDSAAVAGKHVLLVDDIFTTGATARSASRVLLAAGAETVWVATLARSRLRGANQAISAASYLDAAGSGALSGPASGSTTEPASMHSSARHLSS